MVQIKIAVDIGGTKTEVAVISKGKIKEIVKFKTPHTKKKFCDELVEHIKGISKGKKIKGIGVSVASTTYKGVIFNPPNLPIKNFDLKGFLKKKLRVKVEVENDGNCFALAELKHGYGKKYNTFIIVAVGTGIGGGIIINKKLYSGHGAAGEIGHMIISDSNQKDGSGIHGSFEAIASGKALVKLAKKRLGKEYFAYELVDMAKKGNKKAQKILDEVSYYLGEGLTSITKILNPDAIILTGGVILDGGSMILDTAKKILNKNTHINPKVHISKLKKGAIIGASELVK